MVRKEKKVRNAKNVRKLFIACLTWVAVIVIIMFTAGCSEVEKQSNEKEEVNEVLTKPEYYIEVNSVDMELLFYTGDMFITKYENLIYPIQMQGINKSGEIRYSDPSCAEPVFIGDSFEINRYINLGGVVVGYSEINNKILVAESLIDNGHVWTYLEKNGDCILDRGNLDGYSVSYKLTQYEKPVFIETNQTGLVFPNVKITQ